MKSAVNWTRDYFYNTNDNYLLGHSNGTTEYTYDERGNMLSMPHLTSMQWDYKDELKEVTLNASGDKAYYVYDAGGERVRKVIEKPGGIIEERIYLGGYEVYRKTISGTLNFERETLHISDDTKKIAGIETKTVENGSTISSPVSNIRYQYDNHLGSASLELDDLAAIISYEEYHPFGTTSYRSGRIETEVSLKKYKYVGKERDDETGLYYYGARYYAAWIARFISVDPLQFEYPHYTPYQYAGNKPISYIDLDGLEEIKYDESSDRYYDSRRPNSVSCLVSNKYNIAGRPIANETYKPGYKVPLEVKVLGLASIAAPAIAMAAPAIAEGIITTAPYITQAANASVPYLAQSALTISEKANLVYGATANIITKYPVLKDLFIGVVAYELPGPDPIINPDPSSLAPAIDMVLFYLGHESEIKRGINEIPDAMSELYLYAFPFKEIENHDIPLNPADNTRLQKQPINIDNYQSVDLRINSKYEYESPTIYEKQ